MGKEKCEMNKKMIGFSVGLMLVLAVPRSLAQSLDVEISPVDSVGDLDLSGEIMYAINFGNNGTPTVGGITFAQDQDCSDVVLGAKGEGPSTWYGPYPGTGDAELNHLLDGFAYTNGSNPSIITITINGLSVDGGYRLQLIAYEPQNTSRNIDIIVGDKQIVTGLNPIVEQHGIVGKGGLVI
jgi:hypothetical protein